MGETGEEALAAEVAEVVRHQARIGLDIVGRRRVRQVGVQFYLAQRLGGVELREADRSPMVGRDVDEFPAFYAYALSTRTRWRRPTFSSTQRPRLLALAAGAAGGGRADHLPARGAPARHREPQGGAGRRRRGRGLHAGRGAGQRRGRLRQRALRHPGGAALCADRRAARGVPGDPRRRLRSADRRRVDPCAVDTRAGAHDGRVPALRRHAHRGAQPRARGPARRAHPLPPVLGQLARPARQRRAARRHRRPDALGQRRDLPDRGGQRPPRARGPRLGDDEAPGRQEARARRRHPCDEPHRAPGSRGRPDRRLRRSRRGRERHRQHRLRHGLARSPPSWVGRSSGPWCRAPRSPAGACSARW